MMTNLQRYSHYLNPMLCKQRKTVNIEMIAAAIHPKAFSLFTMKLFKYRISISIDRRFVFFEE